MQENASELLNSSQNNQTGGVQRSSGIELLKIIGIFLIVLNHVLGTLRSGSSYVPYDNYVVPYHETATLNFQYVMLVILSYSGILGNAIFFISSAWFLLDSKKFNAKKWFYMLVETWVISIIILVSTLIARRGDIRPNLIIKSLFPNICGNAWYITCYLLFYPIHTILNKVIGGLSQRQLFSAATALTVLYFGFNYLWPNKFFPSDIISWVVIYFVIAYIKLYGQNFANSKSANVILLLVGIVCLIAVVLVSELLGVKFSSYEDKVFRLVDNHFNPFVIATALAAFNLARMTVFKSKFINYLSHLSLLIYIIHYNLIINSYYRPLLMNLAYETFGYGQIVLLMLAVAVVIFVSTAIVAFVCDKLLHKLLVKLSDLLHNICSNVWNKIVTLATRPTINQQ